MSPTTEVVLNACCTLVSLTSEADQAIATEVLNCDGLAARLIYLSQTPTKSDTQLFALNALSNITSEASEAQLADLIKLNLLPALSCALMNSDAVVSLACQTLSNLCARSTDLIASVIKADLIRVASNLAENSSNHEVRMYATYCMMYACYGASLVQMQSLVSSGCIDRIVAVSKTPNLKQKQPVELVCEAFKCLDTVLFKFERVSDFDYVAGLVDATGGWDSVSRLCKCKVDEVRQLALTVDRVKMRE
eukprot:gene6741-8592_t